MLGHNQLQCKRGDFGSLCSYFFPGSESFILEAVGRVSDFSVTDISWVGSRPREEGLCILLSLFACLAWLSEDGHTLVTGVNVVVLVTNFARCQGLLLQHGADGRNPVDNCARAGIANPS